MKSIGSFSIILTCCLSYALLVYGENLCGGNELVVEFDDVFSCNAVQDMEIVQNAPTVKWPSANAVSDFFHFFVLIHINIYSLQ